MEDRKILWVSDFSETAAMSLKTTKMLSKIPNQQVIALHIIDNPLDSIYRPEETSPINRLTHAEKVVKERFKKMFDEVGLSSEFYKILAMPGQLGGQVGEEIMEVAKKEKPWIIIMGRGSKLERLLGSVSEYVLANARCPVIIVGRKVSEKSLDIPPSIN
jgi:universal stress protein A